MTCLVLLATNAYADVSLNTGKFFRLDQPYEVSGSVVVDDQFYIVMDNQPTIYTLKNQNENSIPTLHIDLTQLKGYSEYAASHTINLEGITYCSGAFYLVNEKTNDVLKVAMSELTALPIDKSYLGSEYSKNGLEGIAVDCKHDMLFVASQSFPQKVVVYKLIDNRYVTTFDLSGGVENKINNISDLSFLNDQLFVLQKNRSSIMKIWVYGNKNGPVLERLDYSKYAYIFDSNQYDANGNMINKDFAEGLVVKGNDYFLFYDQGKSGAVSQKGRNLGLNLDNRGVVLQLSN